MQDREHVRHESTWDTKALGARVAQKNVEHEGRKAREHVGKETWETQKQAGHKEDEAWEQVGRKAQRENEHLEHII